MLKKKIETGSRQNDGTMDKEQTQRSPSPWASTPASFRRQKCRSRSELGGSGQSSPALSEFGSQEVDWQPNWGPLAISGKTPGTSQSQMILLPKILTRNLSLTWGQVVEARNESFEESWTFLPAPMTLS